jgi:hypothetical protein
MRLAYYRQRDGIVKSVPGLIQQVGRADTPKIARFRSARAGFHSQPIVMADRPALGR